jgi:hypothetical protein
VFLPLKPFRASCPSFGDQSKINMSELAEIILKSSGGLQDSEKSQPYSGHAQIPWLDGKTYISRGLDGLFDGLRTGKRKVSSRGDSERYTCAFRAATSDRTGNLGRKRWPASVEKDRGLETTVLAGQLVAACLWARLHHLVPERRHFADNFAKG